MIAPHLRQISILTFLTLASLALALTFQSSTHVHAQVPTVDTVLITEKTKTSAKVNVTIINPGNTSQTVHMRYRETGGSNRVPEPVTTTGTTATFPLTGLTEDTDYEVEAALNSDFSGSITEGFFTAYDPDPPFNLEIVEGDGTISLSWDTPSDNGGSPITGFIVRWALRTETLDASSQQTVTAETKSYTIRGLINGLEYQVAVISVTALGQSAVNPIHATPNAVPIVHDATIDPETITDVEAVVAVSVDNASLTSTTVYLRYKAESETSWRQPTLEADVISSQPDVTFTLSNLTQGTDYDVEASLAMDFSSGVVSRSFSTDDVPAAPAISIFPGHQRLRVAWTVDPRGSEITFFNLRWTEVQTGTTFPELFPNKDRDGLNILSLTNGTEYRVEFRAENEYGWGDWAEVLAAPVEGPSVDEVTVSDITTSGAKVTVSIANTDGNRRIVLLGYRISGQGSDYTVLESSPTSAATVEFTLSNLLGFTQYQLSASLESNLSAGLTKSFTTEEVPPFAPTDLAIVPMDSRLKLTWMPPSNDGGSRITGYTIQWKSGNQAYSGSRQKTTEHHVRTEYIDDLTNGTKYTVKVLATSDLGNGTSVEAVAMPSTVPKSPPINLLASQCNESLHLSWQAPVDNGGTPITSYTIQWKSGVEDYDATSTSSRQHVSGTSGNMYTIATLENGTTYTIRILATNVQGDALDENGQFLWSQEITGIPRPGPCVSEVGFGNILADSAPVIVDLKDTEDGTDVYMRHRPTDSGQWSDTQHKIVNAGDTTVTFDATDLQPDQEYETEVSLDSGFAPQSTARAFFTSGEAPPGTTIRGGASFARILRIEPGIQNIVVSPGDRIRLDVNVYGRQGLLANDLADRAPADGRPTFTWTSDRGGSFAESSLNADWRNAQADDRQITFTAPETPGTVEIKAALLASSECQPTLDDETSDDQIERCSATFNLTVRRLSAAEPQRPAPVNPPGTIPETLTDPEGTAYAVFTPRDGGNFLGDGYSFSAGAGAVANNEFIGISIAPSGDASNDGMTHHRYSLAGAAYAIKVIDSSSQPVTDYVLQEAATVCLPLPNEHRANIADIAIAAIDEDDGLTILASSVKITTEGVIACGGISTIPANVAVGTRGAPQPIPTIEPEATEQTIPDTGGTAPTAAAMLILLLLGIAIITTTLATRKTLLQNR